MTPRQDLSRLLIIFRCMFLFIFGGLMLMALIPWLPWIPRVVTEYSEELTEPATVIEKIHTPSSHTMGLVPKLDLVSGSVALELGLVTAPEKYGLLFRCQHGEFVIQGSDDKYQTLYKQFEREQRVTVHYREAYHMTYQGDELMQRELFDYDFLYAE